MESGEFFNSSAYDYNENSIPVILGYDFQSAYSIGDTMDFLYIGKIFHGQVIGFLKKASVIDVDSAQHVLNNYLIMPFVAYDSVETIANEDNSTYANNDKEFFLKMYWLFRDNALIYIGNKDDFDKSQKTVEALADEYELKFELLRGY
jgi:hypothetical protein